MSDECDELADVIKPAAAHDYWPQKAAELVLAAGYRKPRQVTTVEELDALEGPEVILVDYKHNAYQWGIGLDGSEGWQSTRDPNPITSHHLRRFAPLTVLHVGGAS